MALQRCLQKEGASEEKLAKVQILLHHFLQFGERIYNLLVFISSFNCFYFLLYFQMVSKLPIMKSICNLHIDKLEFFRLVHPETAYTFPPLYREVFGSEITFPDSTEGYHHFVKQGDSNRDIEVQGGGDKKKMWQPAEAKPTSSSLTILHATLKDTLLSPPALQASPFSFRVRLQELLLGTQCMLPLFYRVREVLKEQPT